MPQPEWESIERELRNLSDRIARIEQHLDLAPWGQVPERSVPEPASHPAMPAVPALPETTALLPIVGRSLLALAGAYLLRAVTESGSLGPKAGVAAGILYAIVWLVWAARVPAAQRLEIALLSLTSALVLSPLLWEATVRFHAVSTWTAGAILVFFTVVALAVSWRKDQLIIATIATLAGLATAAALLLATNDVLPFTFVFLAIAAAVEASACLDHWLGERWLAACAADLSVLLATWLVTNERGLPQAYAPIPHPALAAAQAALLVIYLSSTIIRTLFRRSTFTNFETVQCALAFLISVGGGLRLANVAPQMALFAIACGGACYVVSFALLDRDNTRSRNFYTYSTFGILLAVAGSRILLSGVAAALLWSVFAVACIWAGGHFSRLTLQLHGGIYLLLALASAGALQQAVAFLLGSASWPGENPAVLGLGFLAAAFCYLLACRGGIRWQALGIFLAGAVVCLAAGLSAGALTGLCREAFGADSSHAYCATLRTAVLAGASLLLAWAGSRWSRVELSRLVYPAMLLGAWRLITEDLHQDRKAALFLSLLVYGAALTALPRLVRARSTSAAGS